MSAAIPLRPRGGHKPVIAWELGRVVRELRAARTEWSQPGARERARAAQQLPSRAELDGVMTGLRTALFPTHFGAQDLSDESLDYFVGHTLDATLSTLYEQVRRELSRELASEASTEQRAIELTREFASRLPHVRSLLQSDVQAGFDGDPAATSLDEVVFCYPGISAVTNHRVAHELYRLGAPLAARIIAELAHSETGIDIHPGAQIGESFFIDHGTGVVIGETSIIGARVRLYQGVTLGARSFPRDEDGTLVKGNPRHPILEDDVVIYAGATVLGRITIGRGASIGGNAWVTRSVKPHTRVTLPQARGESFAGGAGI
ncbi:MAG TPA: serine O-acetyltransferase EpsC [Polyangiales bacterium]